MVRKYGNVLELELEVSSSTQSCVTAFKISQNTSTSREKSPTELIGAGKLNLPRRSAHWRQLLLQRWTEAQWKIELLLMECFFSVPKYGKMADICKYFNSSKKLKRATAMKIYAQAKEYEESNENFIWSLSLLYAGGHWKGKIPAREINNGYETYWEKNHERVPLKREKKI